MASLVFPATVWQMIRFAFGIHALFVGAADNACSTDGEACSVHQSEPAMALLQRQSRLDEASQEPVHRAVQPHESMLQNSKSNSYFLADDLPVDVRKLLDKHLCNGSSKQANGHNSEPASVKASADKTNTSDAAGRKNILPSKSQQRHEPKAKNHKNKAHGSSSQQPLPISPDNLSKSSRYHTSMLQAWGLPRLDSNMPEMSSRKLPERESSIPEMTSREVPEHDRHAFSRPVSKQKDLGESTAMTAALDESGFRKVAGMRSDSEMKTYVRRVAESCNMKITNDGGLNGLVGWLNGKDAEGSFGAIKKAMFKALLAASKDHWVDATPARGITGESAPLNVIGYVQVRGLRKPKQMIQFLRRMIKNMGVRITDQDGFKGFVHYYSEPDDSESFQRLMTDIKKATFEHSWAELE